MSRSPNFFVEKYNCETKEYELQHPYVWNYGHKELIPASLYPYNGDHDLFSIVEDKGFGDFPDMKGIHWGLPDDVCSYIKEKFDECSYESTFGEDSRLITPQARWFTYADMYIYCLEHPKVVDYEAMEEAYLEESEKEIEKIYKDTPMKNLKNRIDAFLEVFEGFYWKEEYSQLRIVYWIN